MQEVAEESLEEDPAAQEIRSHANSKTQAARRSPMSTSVAAAVPVPLRVDPPSPEKAQDMKNKSKSLDLSLRDSAPSSAMLSLMAKEAEAEINGGGSGNFSAAGGKKTKSKGDHETSFLSRIFGSKRHKSKSSSGLKTDNTTEKSPRNKMHQPNQPQTSPENQMPFNLPGRLERSGEERENVIISAAAASQHLNEFSSHHTVGVTQNRISPPRNKPLVKPRAPPPPPSYSPSPPRRRSPPMMIEPKTEEPPLPPPLLEERKPAVIAKAHSFRGIDRMSEEEEDEEMQSIPLQVTHNDIILKKNKSMSSVLETETSASSASTSRNKFHSSVENWSYASEGLKKSIYSLADNVAMQTSHSNESLKTITSLLEEPDVLVQTRVSAQPSPSETPEKPTSSSVYQPQEEDREPITSLPSRPSAPSPPTVVTCSSNSPDYSDESLATIGPDSWTNAPAKVNNYYDVIFDTSPTHLEGVVAVSGGGVEPVHWNTLVQQGTDDGVVDGSLVVGEPLDSLEIMQDHHNTNSNTDHHHHHEKDRRNSTNRADLDLCNKGSPPRAIIRDTTTPVRGPSKTLIGQRSPPGTHQTNDPVVIPLDAQKEFGDHDFGGDVAAAVTDERAGCGPRPIKPFTETFATDNAKEDEDYCENASASRGKCWLPDPSQRELTPETANKYQSAKLWRSAECYFQEEQSSEAEDSLNILQQQQQQEKQQQQQPQHNQQQKQHLLSAAEKQHQQPLSPGPKPSFSDQYRNAPETRLEISPALSSPPSDAGGGWTAKVSSSSSSIHTATFSRVCENEPKQDVDKELEGVEGEKRMEALDPNPSHHRCLQSIPQEISSSAQGFSSSSQTMERRSETGAQQQVVDGPESRRELELEGRKVEGAVEEEEEERGMHVETGLEVEGGMVMSGEQHDMDTNTIIVDASARSQQLCADRGKEAGAATAFAKDSSTTHISTHFVDVLAAKRDQQPIENRENRENTTAITKASVIDDGEIENSATPECPSLDSILNDDDKDDMVGEEEEGDDEDDDDTGDGRHPTSGTPDSGINVETMDNYSNNVVDERTTTTGDTLSSNNVAEDNPEQDNNKSGGEAAGEETTEKTGQDSHAAASHAPQVSPTKVAGHKTESIEEVPVPVSHTNNKPKHEPKTESPPVGGPRILAPQKPQVSPNKPVPAPRHFFLKPVPAAAANDDSGKENNELENVFAKRSRSIRNLREAREDSDTDDKAEAQKHFAKRSKSARNLGHTTKTNLNSGNGLENEQEDSLDIVINVKERARSFSSSQNLSMAPKPFRPTTAAATENRPTPPLPLSKPLIIPPKPKVPGNKPIPAPRQFRSISNSQLLDSRRPKPQEKPASKSSSDLIRGPTLQAETPATIAPGPTVAKTPPNQLATADKKLPATLTTTEKVEPQQAPEQPQQQQQHVPDSLEDVQVKKMLSAFQKIQSPPCNTSAETEVAKCPEKPARRSRERSADESRTAETAASPATAAVGPANNNLNVMSIVSRLNAMSM